MLHQGATEIPPEGIRDTGDLALAEACSAKRAANLAAECADEAEALAREHVDMAAAWARVARECAGLAFGHSTRAIKASAPLSPASRQAKESADLAAGFAHSAEECCRRD
jgi:hypothetical protein